MLPPERCPQRVRGRSRRLLAAGKHNHSRRRGVLSLPAEAHNQTILNTLNAEGYRQSTTMPFCPRLAGRRISLRANSCLPRRFTSHATCHISGSIQRNSLATSCTRRHVSLSWTGPHVCRSARSCRHSAASLRPSGTWMKRCCSPLGTRALPLLLPPEAGRIMVGSTSQPCARQGMSESASGTLFDHTAPSLSGAAEVSRAARTWLHSRSDRSKQASKRSSL